MSLRHALHVLHDDSKGEKWWTCAGARTQAWLCHGAWETWSSKSRRGDGAYFLCACAYTAVKPVAAIA
jgi:hypothetical protein